MPADPPPTGSGLEQLRRNAAYFQQLFESSPDAIVRLDAELRVQDANAAFERLFGYTKQECLGVPIDTLAVPPERAAEAAELSARTLGGATVVTEVERRRRDGTRFVATVRGYPVIEDGRHAGLFAVYHDITAQRALEEQLRQAQKMEAVGRLAGGIAHDFNNLLTAITGYSELLLHRLDGADPRHAEAAEILRAGRRATELTRQLLTLSRRQVLAPRPLEPDLVLADMESLLRRLLGEDLELVTDLAAGGAVVRCDPGQLEQVILNLAVNARDAMADGGRLEISTRIVEIDAARARRHVDLAPGRYVELSFTDTGVGMPPAVLDHIFEPFFTTKAHGQGTGLGLSTVYSIVRQSSGQIEVASRERQGSTFTIRFPATAGPAHDAPRAPAERDELPAGSETVLLVEDEPAVRELLAATLADRGYRVLEAGDGLEALAVAERAALPIDLLLTDLVMPRLGGHELAQRLAAAHPGLAVLFISGYAARSPEPASGASPEGATFLQKPFDQRQLLGALRGALAKAPGRTARTPVA